MFDTLRTAWNLAQRVNEVESRFEEIENEWESTLSRLKQLTGRLAKRDAREVARNLDAGADATAQDAPQGTNEVAAMSKDQLRALARSRGLGVPRRAVQ